MGEDWCIHQAGTICCQNCVGCPYGLYTCPECGLEMVLEIEPDTNLDIFKCYNCGHQEDR